MNGLYIGAMGMMTNQLQLNTHANNVANAQTNGYKFDTMVATVFETKQTVRTNSDAAPIGVTANKVVNVHSPIHWGHGNFVETGNNLDVSLMDRDEKNATSFFVVQNEQGLHLTRSGDFTLNENRTLKTQTGEFVLDVNNNQIQIEEGMKVSVDKEGILRDETTGVAIAQLQLKQVEGDARSLLEKESDGKFLYNGNINDLPNSEAQVESGIIETSNVDLSAQLVELVQAQRRFQSSQKVMMAFDKIYEKEANDLL